MKKKLALVVACACMPATALSMPLSASAHTSKPAKVSRQDATWLKTSIQTDLAEIQSGKLAQRKSGNGAVVKLGRTLVTDHTALLKAAKRLASNYKLHVPKSPSAKQKAQTAAVSRESGRNFNLGFSKMEIAGHKTAIAQTKAEIAKGSDTSFKTAARSSLPMLKMHLRLAEAALKASR